MKGMSLVSIPVVFLFVFLAAQGQEKAAKAEKFEVKPIGLIVAVPPDDFDSNSVHTIGPQPGVIVYLKLKLPCKSIVKLDDKNSKLASFKDDKDTDLAKDTTPWAGQTVSTDGQSLMFAVETKQTPSPQANRLKIKANLVLVLGTENKTEVLKDVAVKEGTVLKVGKNEMKISQVSKVEAENEKTLDLCLESSQGYDMIRKIEFLDKQDKPIKLEETSATVGDSQTIIGKTFTLSAQPETVTVKVTYVAKTESLEIPVETSLNLGLSDK